MNDERRMARGGAWLALKVVVFACLHVASPDSPSSMSWEGDAGSGQCGRGGVRISARWDTAIASYDAVARSLWLEFDIEDADTRQGLRRECLASAYGHEFEAHVILDDEVVARTQDTEAGVILGHVDLGRHWLIVRLVDSAGMEITHQLVEFTLAWHPHIRITEPPNRHSFPALPSGYHAATSSLRTCFTLLAAGNCSSELECAPQGPAQVSVDSIRRAVVAHIEATDPGEQTCVDLSGDDLWSVGRHTITVEMLDVDGQAWGPISYLHHYSVVEGSMSEGYKWITSLFLTKGSPAASLQAVPPQWDSLIDLGGWSGGQGKEGDGGNCGGIVPDGMQGAACDAGGNGHAVFINPSVFRVGSSEAGQGRGTLEWQILFREHQLKAPGVKGYRKRLQPSAQWFARLRLVTDATTAHPYFQLQEGSAVRMRIATGRSPAMEGARGPQDARLLPLSSGAVLVWFNANSEWRTSRVTQQFQLVQASSMLSSCTGTTIEVKLSHQIYEKNFVPFEYRSEVFFAYTLEPHSIYKLNLEDGSSELQVTSSNRRLREAIGRADIWLHGGGAPIRVSRSGSGVGAEYLSVYVPFPTTYTIEAACACCAVSKVEACSEKACGAGATPRSQTPSGTQRLPTRLRRSRPSPSFPGRVRCSCRAEFKWPCLSL